MGKGEKDVEIAASPAAVWAVVANFGDLSFFPGVTSVRMDGDATRVVTAGGHEIREHLIELDDDNMSLRYTVTEGLRASTPTKPPSRCGPTVRAPGHLFVGSDPGGSCRRHGQDLRRRSRRLKNHFA